MTLAGMIIEFICNVFLTVNELQHQLQAIVVFSSNGIVFGNSIRNATFDSDV